MLGHCNISALRKRGRRMENMGGKAGKIY